MANSPHIEQRDIRLAVEVIRRWFLTLCHDRCIDPLPEVEIRKPAVDPTYKIPLAGEASSEDYRVRVYLQPSGTETEYLKTLAHELYHLWLHVNGEPQEERRCEEYEEYVLKRFHNGPEASRYDGQIIGLSHVYHCPRCGVRLVDHKICMRCIQREEKETRIKAEAASKRRADDRAAEEHRRLVEQQNAAAASLRQKEIDWWLKNIDQHPSNGKSGYWLVEGDYYVHARTAGEALIKLSERIDLGNLRRPKVKFVGEKVARGSNPLR